MGFINVEIKAKCSDPENIERKLLNLGAEFKGTDHQVDTYFNVTNGWLKLREGNIENALIGYLRKNKAGPKTSEVILYKTESGSPLKNMLVRSLGIHTVVDKQRKIFFIGHVKFHIDSVNGLGQFVEIEAIDSEGTMDKQRLREDCEYYMKELGISRENLEPFSYSDLLIK